VLRLFAAWPGVALQDGLGTYDLVRGNYYSFERQFPYATRLERWNYVKQCLREVAAFGEEFGVTMALQNHMPLTRDWKDTYDLVREVASPWLKMCLDLPMMVHKDRESVRQAALTVGALQVHSHFGGEYYRGDDGSVLARRLEHEQSLPDYGYFLELMREIGYDGWMSFELCHPLLNDRHEYLGLDYAHEQTKLAREFLQQLVTRAGLRAA
jgi:sugar phosphate isomerase/epimerase